MRRGKFCGVFSFAAGIFPCPQKAREKPSAPGSQFVFSCVGGSSNLGVVTTLRPVHRNSPCQKIRMPTWSSKPMVLAFVGTSTTATTTNAKKTKPSELAYLRALTAMSLPVAILSGRFTKGRLPASGDNREAGTEKFNPDEVLGRKREVRPFPDSLIGAQSEFNILGELSCRKHYSPPGCQDHTPCQKARAHLVIFGSPKKV